MAGKTGSARVVSEGHEPGSRSALAVLTIGHSTRPIEEFIAMLRGHGVARVVDVRSVPRSRHNPQFNADVLASALAAAGIGYTHQPGLGGLRHPARDSPNTGWRNASFRGFADYMQTPAFEKALGDLLEQASREPVVLMCAEAVPWRCHRSLIADALLARGVRAEHILTPGRPQAHELTPFAKVLGLRVTYPA
jgi:uncharacterized protein (DUF488 family)